MSGIYQIHHLVYPDYRFVLEIELVQRGLQPIIHLLSDSLSSNTLFQLLGMFVLYFTGLYYSSYVSRFLEVFFVDPKSHRIDSQEAFSRAEYNPTDELP